MVPHRSPPAPCCDGHHIYRTTVISLTVSAAHGQNITQAQPKRKTFSHERLHFHLHCLKRLFMSSIYLFHSYNRHVHIYPCFSLHPGINALHYPHNREANDENFLFKRLFSFSKKLFNCSTQPYQRKSRCPCQKTQSSFDNKVPEDSFSVQRIRSVAVHADVCWDHLAP